MRELADSARIEQFMRELGRAVYVDIKLIPDRDEILPEIPRLKEALSLNIELAAPSDFIPLPSGWEDRSP
jgi:hypothetical protein